MEKKATKRKSEKANKNPYVVTIRCSNGHISYFDRRIVCTDSGNVKRSSKQAESLDELYVKCKECSEEMIIQVDCEGLR